MRKIKSFNENVFTYKINYKNSVIYFVDFKFKKDFYTYMLRLTCFQEYMALSNKERKKFGNFTHANYENYLKENHKGKFCDSTLGVNITDTMIKDMFDLQFKFNIKETSEESELLLWLKNDKAINIEQNALNPSKQFSICAINREINDKNEIKIIKMHELSHALYYIDDNYKHIVKNAWLDFISKKPGRNIIRFLSKHDYDYHEMPDEFGAWFIDGYLVENGYIDNISKSLKNKSNKMKKYFNKSGLKKYV